MSDTTPFAVPFSPPPPGGGGGGGPKTSAFSPAVVSIIAVLGSAFLVVSYYRIFAKLCSRWQNRRNLFDLEDQFNGTEMDANASPLSSHGLDEVLIKKIPIFVYKTGDAFTVDTDCPVCLMEFADHQELRMLPKCAHAFHVGCIDTWLNTHSTCPLCRANIWPEQVMIQFAPSAQVNMFDPIARQAAERERLEFHSRAGDGARLNGGHGRSSAPTLRGLLNFEDQHTIWIPESSEAGDPGEESLRLYDPRDHGGDSSARHHSGVLPNTPTPSISENVDSRSGTYFSTDTGPQVSLTRAASFKEPHSWSRDREHKWHIPARRPSLRRNPFSIVRSYSMGTSRRLVHALEFLDLEDIRSSNQSKPHEYGITATPDFPISLRISPNDLLVSSDGVGEKSEHVAGPSTRELAPSSKSPDSSNEADLSGRALKSSAAGKGRSLSFRSPFMLKRSLSGRNLFSIRYSSKGRIFSASDSSPTPPGS